MINKPTIKNTILIGIPTLISGIGIIMTMDILENYKNLFIVLTVLLLIIFIAFIIYYGKQENDINKEILKLKNTIFSINKLLGLNSQIVISIINLLENWNRDINKIANDIKKSGVANEKDWDYEKICTDICISCKEAIIKFTETNNNTDISVAFIKYYKSNNNEYVKMIAHSSPQTAKPDVYDKEELLQECMYQYAKMIREQKRTIFALENTEKIKQYFYKKKPETDLSKYNQYIALPVICSKNKYLGILQITTKYNYSIMKTNLDLEKFGETYITPFVELLILVEKIEKGIFVKPEYNELRIVNNSFKNSLFVVEPVYKE